MSKKKLIIGVTIFIAAILSLGLFLKMNTYHASNAAQKIVQENIETTDYYLIKNKNVDNKESIIFYPGALVTPQSYSLWAQKLADEGHPVYLLKMPLNLAVLAPNKANRLITKHPQQKFILAGHSLGGVMASRFSAQHQKQIDGMIYLASYPDKKGALKNTGIPVLSLTASQDGVLNKKKYLESKKLLPNNTNFVRIKGGNHAGFGSYGHQKGDKKAKISNQKQQEEIAEQINNWLPKRHS